MRAPADVGSKRGLGGRAFRYLLETEGYTPFSWFCCGLQSYDISGERLIEVDEQTAALVYEARASRGDDQFHALMSTVYTRFMGQWRIALYQQTPVPTDG